MRIIGWVWVLFTLAQMLCGSAFADGTEAFYQSVRKERSAICAELEDPNNQPLVQLPKSFSPCSKGDYSSSPLGSPAGLNEIDIYVPHQEQIIRAVESDPRIQKSQWEENRELIDKTKYLAGVSAFFMFAVLKQLPEDHGGWEENDIDEDYLDGWLENVKKGPVFDEDSWAFNYVAHPLVGSWYYTLCRNSNYTGAQCLLYNFLISTVMWEYGLEAFEEPPSIQDLLITPLAGALIGEISYILIQEIKKNGGEVLGSRKLGQFLMVALAPVDTLVKQLQSVFEPILKEYKIHGYLEISSRRKVTRRSYELSAHPEFDDNETTIMLKLRVPLAVGWDQNLLRAVR